MLHPIENRQTLLDNRLGSLLTLERDSLNICSALEKASPTDHIKDLFNRQSDTTRQHISALESLTSTLRLEFSESPTRVGLVLHSETNDLIEDSTEDMMDLVTLTAALSAGRIASDIYRTAIALCVSLGFDGVETALTQLLRDHERMDSALQNACDACLRASREREIEEFGMDDEWFHTATSDWFDYGVSSDSGQSSGEGSTGNEAS